MMSPRLSALALCAILAAGAHAPRAAAAGESIESLFGHCAKEGIFADSSLADPEPGKAADEKFARDRLVDIHHLKLDVTPDFKNRTIRGVSTLTFSPISKPVRQLRLDAIELAVDDVSSSAPIEDHSVADDHIEITFAKAISAGEEVSLTIAYSCEPRLGLYFRTPEMGYEKTDTHLWTQGQPETHRHWFPGYDYPNERFTSEVVCRVPAGMTVLSNGSLISENREADTGLTAFHWRQGKPHVNYLISLVAGNFEKLEDRHGTLPLAFFTVPSDAREAANSFRDTAKIIGFLEKEIGVPYPWDKYYNVCVKDFVAGGMENTSVTTLTDRTLFTDAYENTRTTHRLDAHEAAHQWFGDLLTCKDWSHIWLNEGFATYYQILYEGEKFGPDALLYGMLLNADSVLNAKDDKPIVFRGYRHPKEQFDYRAYPKGAWVLHMLRAQLGEPLFRRCIKTYVERNAYGSVVTEDLNRVIEEISGRSFDRFFDQWVYHGGQPELDIKYAWNAVTSQAKITVTQKQKLSERVPLFHFDLPVRFIAGDRAHDFELEVDEASEDFFCKLPVQPEIVRIDPEYTILAKVNFTPPAPLLHAQVANQDDMMGRLLGVKSLAKNKDKATVDRLAGVLRKDPFYGVRIEAAKVLQTIHSDEAFEALRASLAQEDARVRKEVVEAVAKFYSEGALAILRQILKTENNPEILAVAIAAMGKYPDGKVKSHLVEVLDRESYRNHLAEAAIAAMRAQDSPAYIQPLLKKLRSAEAQFTSRGFGSGLETIAYLARNEDDKEPVRQFIAERLQHPKDTVRVDAIKALGTLEDPRSLPLLQGYPVEPADRPENKAAAEAIVKLNGSKPQTKEVNDLRNELLDFQKELRELKKKLGDLEKQAEPESGKETGGEAVPGK